MTDVERIAVALYRDMGHDAAITYAEGMIAAIEPYEDKIMWMHIRTEIRRLAQ